MRELNKPSLLLGLVWVVLAFIAMRTFLGDFIAYIQNKQQRFVYADYAKKTSGGESALE
jgi:hypothetical protein